MTFDRLAFEADKAVFAKALARDTHLKKQAISFIENSEKYDYMYQWSWLGLPILQMPEDVLSIQEIIWACKPTIIIETGIAWGGSVVFHASLMSLYCKSGKVIAIDRVLPQKNIDTIKNYAFGDSIHLIQGDSTDPVIFDQVKKLVAADDRVMLVLDSHHTHNHVLKELRLWSPLVTKGQFLIVADTYVEELEKPFRRSRPWSKGNNPKTAARTFLLENKRFTTDNIYNQRATASSHGDGFLACVSECF